MRTTVAGIGALALVILGAIVIGNPVSGQTDAPSAAFDPQKTYPAEALKADLAVLWDILEEGHGGFDRYTPAAQLRQSFDAVGSGLTGPLTELDFYVRLLPLIAEIKDKGIRACPSRPGPAPIWTPARSIFPFGIRFLGDKAYVLRDLSPDRSVGEGAELLAVEGRPVREILAALLPLVPSDAGIRTAKLRRLESPGAFGRFSPCASARGNPIGSASALIEPGGPGRSRSPGSRRATSSSPAREIPGNGGAPAEVRAGVQRSDGRSDRPAIRRRSGQGPAPIPRFPDGHVPLARREEDARPRHRPERERREDGRIRKVSLRPHHGPSFLYYWALETRKDRYDLFRYTGESAKDAEELARPLSKNSRGWFDVLGHPNRGLQSTRKPHFAGRVAILVDGGSFSATGETTSAFHYYKKAVFFGEECGSGYYGNTSGFMVTATLPATRLQVRVPLVLYTMAVDGYPKDRGIVPDFPVTPTVEDLLAGRDVVMEKALAYLEKRDE